MGIFLSVLKIVGGVLLGIFLLALLLILIILFVPIRYRADAVIGETDLNEGMDKLKENISASATFSWLLHIVSGGISYPESKEFYLKVLCFKVFPPKNKKSEELSEEDYDEALENALEDTLEDESEEKPEDKEEITEKEEGLTGTEDSENKDGTLTGNTEDEPGSDTDETSASDEISDSQAEEDDFEDEKTGFFDFLGKIFETIANIIRIPQDVFAKITYTISRICAKIDMVKNTLSNDIFKRAYEVTKKQLIRVLKMIFPKKFKARLLVGMDDPTVTADILAAYGVMYPVLYNKMYVTPDFDRKILAGEAHLKGRITIFTIVWAAAVLYFNKDVKKTVRRFKKIINS